jgi:hypothetical protein
MEVRFMARFPNRVSRFAATRDNLPIAPLHLGVLLVLWCGSSGSFVRSLLGSGMGSAEGKLFPAPSSV